MSDPGMPRVEPVLVSAYENFAQAKARGRDPEAGSVFDPSASPMHDRAVFIIGAPRSGTSWLQQLLLTHPSIAGAGEMHVFCEGVGALFDNHEGDDPFSGLSGWATRPELVTLVRALVDGLMTTLRDQVRPAATHVLDKTPNHVPYAARLAEVYPDGIFIQIIRDGRDSVASAHDLWSWSDAYSAPAKIATAWRDAVLDCRAHLDGRRYLEVRYEDLLADTAGGLARVFEHIGLPVDDDFCRAAAEFGRTPLNLRPSKATVGARKWADMSPDMEREIYLAAGPLLVELGYVEPEHARAVVGRRSPRRRVIDARAAAERSARRAARTVLRRGRRQPSRIVTVRLAAQALTDVVDNGRDEIAAALPKEAVLVDGDTRVEGADAVAAALANLMAGGRLIRFDADEHAAAARFADTRGQVDLLTLSVDEHARVTEIVVTRRGSDAAASG
jgi:hypothetical protein